MHGMLLEGVMTFVLVFVYFATAVDAGWSVIRTRSPGASPLGLTVTMDMLVGAPVHGRFHESGSYFWTRPSNPPLENHGVYWVGPLFGGVIAGVVYDRSFLHGSAAVVGSRSIWLAPIAPKASCQP